ncbi:hypothetical protein K470DRAFT_260154 [Piedraia hortae CBS 480.64]|uniref:Uncharacterized protein n=1 Tax=Piedraia hortae CBS 480.64 TaxID=1314780 RepID=A0A6A7BSM3_9PEZI|nr:hypothetical protein K470DRAFT_260154 [Piedraia hortae CBS 480.64]
MLDIKTAPLKAWFRRNGGYLHDQVEIIPGRETRTNWRGFSTKDSTLCKVPYTLSLSFLNALVDEEYPAFYAVRHRLSPRLMGIFYLMLQRQLGNRSFWSPYIDALPQEDLVHEVWFEQPEDMKLLEGTDAYPRVTMSMKRYGCEFDAAMACLEKAGMDVGIFTW